MPGNGLQRAFIDVQIGEALANYSLADEPLDRRAAAAPASRSSQETLYLDDELFWNQRIAPVDQTAIDEVPFEGAGISEWIARVPGLYWLPGAKNLRRVNPAEIEHRTEQWITFNPPGKSIKVSGGVGTLRFPPSQDGYRLVTLTTSFNASAGVPTLISPDVWACHKIGEGSVVYGKAILTEMPLQWATQFPVVRDIPRVCLKIDDPRHVRYVTAAAPILIHPFSIMEYWDGRAMFHDFIYASADSSDPKHRLELTKFFEEYRRDKGRDGTYLTAADITNPMWDAMFVSPADMRLHKAPQLRLIEARVRESADNGVVVEELIRRLSWLSSDTTLKRLSSQAGIDFNRWSEGGRFADEVARLVDAAIKSGKQQALLYAAQLELAS